MAGKELASAGHKLGQLVGDWFEEFFVLPLLRNAAEQLELYLDHRFRARKAREGDKVIWKDLDGNEVDYDFVMELNGTDDKIGIPVAFLECFWRRGKRHSKDKARDDSGKLLPMRETYPTARFLGIVAAGDFTSPARTLLQNRQIDVFYIPKDKVISAFQKCELKIDYPDELPETEKAILANTFEEAFTPELKPKVAEVLRDLVGHVAIANYVHKVRSALGALPQEIRIQAQHHSKPVVFETIPEVTAFLKNPQFNFSEDLQSYTYQITYTDGTEFERTIPDLDKLQALHQEIERLASHMESLKG